MSAQMVSDFTLPIEIIIEFSFGTQSPARTLRLRILYWGNPISRKGQPTLEVLAQEHFQLHIVSLQMASDFSFPNKIIIAFLYGLRFPQLTSPLQTSFLDSLILILALLIPVEFLHEHLTGRTYLSPMERESTLPSRTTTASLSLTLVPVPLTSLPNLNRERQSWERSSGTGMGMGYKTAV